MKRKIMAALLSVLVAASLTGCLSDGSSKPEEKEKTTVGTVPKSDEKTDNSQNGGNNAASGSNGEITESMELMRLKFADVPEIESGPELKIADVTAKPGDIAAVTVSVKGTGDNWNNCGIHITYPEVLKCQLENEETRDVKYEPGPAIKKNAGFVAMEWQDNLDEELIRNHERSLFFTAIFWDSAGTDGDIATFYFKVPDDAKPGTVYDLGYFFMDSDMFRNVSDDISYEKYTFEHLQGGSITVR
ncbi:MAG: hypothetical protein IKW96_02150 [Ruminococcus sp.]|uniref:cohesin domain-containing protein n=1 Tax=Ruminococcus sp. TaxID=41978 RepID=UPI0025FBFA63|nr:cohesin domain-containing protein [Ruminococcus sp.]MBR5682072.1 hypothetical protein [Ruminococcus sp.]